MSISPPVLAPPSSVGRAEIRARGLVIPYRRSGGGRPLLLLDGSAERHAGSTDLVESLGAAFRVIVPSVPSDEADLDTWLAAIIDGLGLSGLILVAEGEFRVPALQRALVDPDHVSAIVLLCPGHGSDLALSGTVTQSPGLPVVPLLLLRQSSTAGAIVGALHGFLREASATPDA